MPESESTMRDKMFRPPDRRAAPVTDSQVTRSEFSILTKSAYDTLHRGDDVAGVNLKLKRLAKARVKLGQSLLAIDNCMLDHAGEKKGATYARLRAVRESAERAFTKFPLSIK